MNVTQLQLNLDIEELRTRAKSLLGKLDRYYMELGAVLWTVYEVPAPGTKRPIWDVWGYPSFDACVEEEMGVKAPSANRLRKIYHVLHIKLAAMDPSTREELIKLGYSKLREMQSYLTLANAKEWVAKGKDKTFRQFLVEMKAYRHSQKPEDYDTTPPASEYGKGGEGIGEESGVTFGGAPTPQEPAPFPTVEQEGAFEKLPLPTSALLSVALTPSENDTVEGALAMATAFCATNRKGEALALVAKTYLAMFPESGESPMAFLAQIEAKLGVRLVAMSLDGKVLYGENHVES